MQPITNLKRNIEYEFRHKGGYLFRGSIINNPNDDLLDIKLTTDCRGYSLYRSGDTRIVNKKNVTVTEPSLPFNKKRFK